MRRINPTSEVDTAIADTRTQTLEVVNRIKARRKALGMSAQKLADICTQQGFPLSRSTLANLESGRRTDIELGELIAFAKALQTTVQNFIAEPVCEHCGSKPPAGYRCLHCGRGNLAAATGGAVPE